MSQEKESEISVQEKIDELVKEIKDIRNEHLGEWDVYDTMTEAVVKLEVAIGCMEHAAKLIALNAES